ncbi:MAG: universal stress protein, partial [Hyphomicrobium sp.]
MYKHILIPTDGSDLADRAVEHGLQLAKLTGAELTLLRVTAPPAPLVVEGVVVAYPQEEVQK